MTRAACGFATHRPGTVAGKYTRVTDGVTYTADRQEGEGIVSFSKRQAAAVAASARWTLLAVTPWRLIFTPRVKGVEHFSIPMSGVLRAYRKGKVVTLVKPDRNFAVIIQDEKAAENLHEYVVERATGG